MRARVLPCRAGRNESVLLRIMMRHVWCLNGVSAERCALGVMILVGMVGVRALRPFWLFGARGEQGRKGNSRDGSSPVVSSVAQLPREGQ